MKKIMSMMLAVFLLASLAACGNSSQADTRDTDGNRGTERIS